MGTAFGEKKKKKVLRNGKLPSSRSGGQRRSTAVPFQLPENAGSPLALQKYIRNFVCIRDFLDSNNWIKGHSNSAELFPTAMISLGSLQSEWLWASRIAAVGEESPPVFAQTDKGYSKGHKY